MDKELITVDPKEIAIFVEEGGKFLFKPQAEEQLIKLHNLIVMLTEWEEKIKEQIGQMGKELNPNFKGVKGERVSCTYRKFGAKYVYDWKKKDVAMPFLKDKHYYSVDSEKVDKYLETVGELPEGIVEAPREDKLSISYGDDVVL